MFMDIRVQSTESDTVNVDIALKALQDSGALDASYICNDVVENNLYLQQRKQPCKMSVLLADGDIKTKLDINAFVQIDFTCSLYKVGITATCHLLKRPYNSIWIRTSPCLPSTFEEIDQL